MRSETVRQLAVFDLDSTLIRGDSFKKYLLYAVKQDPSAVLRGWYLPLAYVVYLLGFRDNGWLKTTFLSVLLARKQRDEVCDSGKRFALGLSPLIRSAALDRIEYHREKGHYILLATASPDFYVNAINSIVEFDETVCTRVAWSVDGKFEGLADGNCYGDQKFRMVEESRARLGETNLIAVYTDHSSDKALLAAAETAYLVNPDKQSQLSVKLEGLQIVDWD